MRSSAIFDRIGSHCDRVSIYEDETSIARAKSVIPVDKLKSRIKHNNAHATDTSPEFDHLLLIELLRWFKYEFFSWSNAPPCRICGSATKFSGNVQPTSDELHFDANRVESYKCSDASCNESTRFPRYNDPVKLLETRTGRCGEWANCFTLCATALGYDCRFVVDWTDHVWTEVYSKKLGRWIHCDACENVSDAPLMYEKGWGKKLSLVVAFGRDHVRDVTWRYSIDHRALMKRRKLMFDELALMDYLRRINVRLQERHSDPARQTELQNRYVVEIVEFLARPNVVRSVAETIGRTSGDLEWRKQRGEAGLQLGEKANPKFGFKFIPDAKEIAERELKVEYFSFLDCYVRCNSAQKPDNCSTSCSETKDDTTYVGWRSCLMECTNIQRKIEYDWRQVYLSRCEGSSSAKSGSLSFRFESPDPGKVRFGSLDIFFDCKTYENGQVRAIVCHDNACTRIQSEGNNQVDLQKCTAFDIHFELLGGTGETGWQHSQLFRSPFDSKNALLKIEVKLDLSV